VQPLKKAKIVLCPTCGNASEYSPANPWRPFCRERCKLIDMGAWASESYRIPENNPQEPNDDPDNE
jgi:endogenous inhibitor of DNA gyrase (YacG/DUF329 family)